MSIFEIVKQRIIESDGAMLELTDAEIDALTDDDIESLRNAFGSHTLLKVPPRERLFFDWLKENDTPVWDELWEDDEDMLVSFAFLEGFRTGANGLPICDLEDTDNYFFTARHIRPDGIAGLSGIVAKAGKGRQLSVAEALMFEISIAPVDIWHFCYKYGVPLKRGKSTVEELDTHLWLVHLTKSEDLVKYLDPE